LKSPQKGLKFFHRKLLLP